MILLAGLQGSGKTTTAGKLANIIKSKEDRNILLAACDVYRPAAIEQLQILGIFISPESIQYGVKSMIHQGRMKIIHTKPMVIIDGAHNPTGLQEVRSSIISLFPSKRIILIFGVLKDKNIIDMIFCFLFMPLPSM